MRKISLSVTSSTTRRAPMRPAPLVVVALLMNLCLSPAAGAQQTSSVSQPIVGQSVSPQVYDGHLGRLAPLRLYKEGDPVKVIEDLRESEENPSGKKPSGGSKSVSPQTANIDLSKMPPAEKYKPGDPVRVMHDLRESSAPSAAPSAAPGFSPMGAAPVSVGASFEGIPATGFLPPDVSGAVGPNHYILMVNVAFAIFDKLGNTLAGPSPINALWSGFGGPCSTNNNGDPIVRYDHLADRWLMSQFALPGGPLGFHECVAISRTPDPVAGGWFLYDFPMVAAGNPVFPDYPKIGVWPDAFYMSTQRGFPNGGLDVWAFEREKMLVGAAARQVHFAVGPPSLIFLPSDLDGPTPPLGTPNFFARQVDGARFGAPSRLEIFDFHVDWSNPAASSFTLDSTLPTAFNSILCQGSLMETCIPQPGTAVQLEALSVWTMWRLQFRDFGSHQSLVTNHTVNNGSGGGAVRWYELRRPSGGGPWTIFQQGTHAPDANSRWMASAAMNKAGTLALGYSVSSSTVFPSIRFADRLASDPPGTMGGEVNLMAGGGVQTFNFPARWGNYTTMDIDPQDDCTFWYAGEYIPVTSVAGWHTRISSIHDPACSNVTYMYPAKLICGIQKESHDTRFARGFYATSINVHNPNDALATYTKKLALSIPPGAEKPGAILPIAKEHLGTDEAMEIDCEDIAHRLFSSGLPAPLIEGFVVIESDSSLDVTGVYTTASLDDDGKKADRHSGIEVTQIPERKIMK